eukprot:CAMPEP_0184738444 /NCGR_PEP_ID=MMETSP0315-20130426/1075_1 /TAXON_ID=101924 /ORGANISM="Rhodosorus marinus, Strain UTEX LB 2760" /LENGTH=173 /DNA_ID=CAMNT_0027206137 /DNA_START=114 /DNA_END=635 /DNA_ORIENTATION=-
MQDSRSSTKAKISYDWSQTSDVVLLIFRASKVVKSSSDIEIDKSSIDVSLSRPDCPDYVMSSRLPGEVNTRGSSYTFHSDRVEIRLVKATPGEEWRLPDRSSTKKDWEKIASTIPDQNKGSIDHMLQSIYENADEDTRRAMNKSMQESNGTVLSTDWAKVGSGRVESYKSTES